MRMMNGLERKLGQTRTVQGNSPGKKSTNRNEVMLGRMSENMQARISAESHIPTWTPVARTKMKWDMTTTTTAWRMIVHR